MSGKMILFAAAAAAAALAVSPAFAQVTNPPRPQNPPIVTPAPIAKDARMMPWAKDLTSRDLIGKTVHDPGGAVVANITDVVSRGPNGHPEVVVETPVAGQKKTVVVPLTEIFMEKNMLMTNVFGGASPRNLPDYSAKDFTKYDPARRFGG